MSLRNFGRYKLAQHYFPTVTRSGDATAASAINLFYSVSGKLVEVYGFLSVTTAVGSAYTLNVTLPFAIDLGGSADIVGIAVTSAAGDAIASPIDGNTASNTAEIMRPFNTSTSGHSMVINFAYLQG